MNTLNRYLLGTTSTLATVCMFAATAVAQEAPATETAAPDSAATVAAASAPEPEVTTIAQEDDVRADVKTKSWPNRPMLVTGLVVLGGSYGASAIVAATSDRKADEKLYLPVVGPWLDLNDRGCDEQPCGSDTFNRVLLVGDGVLQGVGALSVLLSLVVPETTTKKWYLIGNEDLHVTPQAGTKLTGFTAGGKF